MQRLRSTFETTLTDSSEVKNMGWLVFVEELLGVLFHSTMRSAMSNTRTPTANSPQVCLLRTDEVPDFIRFLAKHFIALRIVEDVLDRLTDEAGTASDKNDFAHRRLSSKRCLVLWVMARGTRKRGSDHRVQVASSVSTWLKYSTCTV